MLPTGERVPVTSSPARSASGRSTTPMSPPGSGGRSCSPGGGRRIELAFLRGFPFAQVFAPAEDDVVAFEPMTAPTNALVDGGAALPVLAAGESFRAAFSITVE